jgi:hypothetical protein
MDVLVPRTQSVGNLRVTPCFLAILNAFPHKCGRMNFRAVSTCEFQDVVRVMCGLLIALMRGLNLEQLELNCPTHNNHHLHVFVLTTTAWCRRSKVEIEICITGGEKVSMRIIYDITKTGELVQKQYTYDALVESHIMRHMHEGLSGEILTGIGGPFSFVFEPLNQVLKEFKPMTVRDLILYTVIPAILCCIILEYAKS